MCFNLPIIDSILNEKKSTALYLYPMKALANDQLEVLKKIETELETGLGVSVYDGDTPQHARPRIRENARIILSNPYAIHQYLPWHQKWKRFFENLKFVVIDEVHMYRGVFGSNTALLFRRLNRICKHYNSNPQFILLSATIANPKEHAEKLIGKDFTVIDNDGAPKYSKKFCFWNPPYYDDKLEEVRKSPHRETQRLLGAHVHEGFQTICFTVSRKMAELIAMWAKQEAQPFLKEKITTYRAGYLPEERRKIEKKLRQRELLGVASTNALEVGIDIGSLDAVIISGYPGSIISTWQQAGRAGRKKESIVTLVAFDNQLDQYFMNHPESFFGTPHEHAIIDLQNPHININHLMCAAAEIPLKKSDKEFFLEFKDGINALETQGLVKKLSGVGNEFVYSGKARPVEVCTLDNISDEIVKVVCNGNTIETLDLFQAFDEAHAGAVLLHMGETYIVEELDLKNKIAIASSMPVDYYTETTKTINIDELEKIKENKKQNLSLGKVKVTETIYGFKEIRFEKIIAKKPLDNLKKEFETTAIWFKMPEKIQEKVNQNGLDLLSGLHAIEHAMIGMMPFYCLCDRRDIGGLSTKTLDETGIIYIYDGFKGGIGITEKAFEMFDKLLAITYKVISKCKCQAGCPACIYSPKCGNANTSLDKKTALFILKELTKKQGSP